MLLGAHWAYWAGLAVALLVAGALELVRRARRRERVFFAALLEQGRRELELEQRTRGRAHYRPEQSVRGVQQRLSRHIGKRAFSEKWRLRIVRALGLAD